MSWPGPLALLRGNVAADVAVPPGGAAATLTWLATLATALMAAFAIAGALAADRAAARWSATLNGAATLELPADPEAERPPQERLARAQAILSQTPGIASARPLDAAETRALLAPWIGDEAVLQALDPPLLIAVQETAALDRAGLVARLEGEVPGAVYHTHAEWRDAATAAAARLRWLGAGFAVLALGVAAAVAALAVRAALAMNGPVIETLRLIGAKDAYIARAFVRRFTLRALAGAMAGSVLGALLIAMMPSGAAGPLSALPPAGVAGWAMVLLPPPVIVAAAAFLVCRQAAFATLARVA